MKRILRKHSFGILGLGLVAIALAGCGSSSSGGSGSAVVVNTVTSTYAGSANSGATDGAGTTATFNNPVNVAVDDAGNAYISDFDNNRVRRINTFGVVDTLVAPLTTPNFQRPFGIAVAPDGTVYVQTDADDAGNRTIETGTVWRVNINTRTATVIARNLGRPRGLTVLPDGRIVLIDNEHHDIRLLNPNTGVVTALAGLRNTPGNTDGTGVNARFNRPYGAAITPGGNIIVADQNNNQLREVTSAGAVTTFAGDGTPGFREGARQQAQFNGPQDVAIDSAGVVYVSDIQNRRIRRISTNGTVATIAGDGLQGFMDGSNLASRFFAQEGLDVTDDGRTVYVADGNGGAGGLFNRVRRIVIQ